MQGSTPPDEVARLARVFRVIDSWAEDPNFDVISAMTQNSKSGTLSGRDVSREFARVMFHGDDIKLARQTDCGIALLAARIKASDLYYQFKFMVDYLEAGGGTEPVRNFLQAIKQDSVASNHWRVSPTEEFKYVWDTLWNVLNFNWHPEVNRTADTFQAQIHNLFPPQSRRIQTSTSFSTNLTDLESVDLRVKPTNKIDEHFVVEGNAVLVFKLIVEDIWILTKFDANRAARALGIATLGGEVLASMHALYGKDEFFDKAEAAGIFAPKDELTRILGARAVRDHANVQPAVLAYRTRALQKLVDHRRSWWPSLIRDVKKQLNSQPLFFYGAILAVFFGVCTVIQTVTSVWTLSLALQGK